RMPNNDFPRFRPLDDKIRRALTRHADRLAGPARMPVGARPIQFECSGSGHRGDLSSETRPTCAAGASADPRGIRRNLGHVAGKALVAPEIIAEIQATGRRSYKSR